MTTPSEEFLFADLGSTNAKFVLHHPMIANPIAEREVARSLLRSLAEPLDGVRLGAAVADSATTARAWSAQFEGATLTGLTLSTRTEEGGEARVFLSSFPAMDAWQQRVQARSRALAPEVRWHDGESSAAFDPGAIDESALDPKLPFELSNDFKFDSPILAKQIVGKSIAERVFSYTSLVYGDRSYGRKIMQGPLILSLWTARVGEDELDVANLLRVNAQGQVCSMEMFMRPWPVVSAFRSRCEALTSHFLDESYFRYL
jgi:hypothetical protein